VKAAPRKKLSRAVLRERLPGYIGQAVLLVLVLWLAGQGIANFIANVRALGVSSGYGFLRREAGFDIAQALIPFGPASTYGDAVLAALLNTVLVVVLASVFATVIALLVAFGRLGVHPLVRGLCGAYVEVFRNVPLLLQIFFWYFSAIAWLPGVSDSIALGPVLLNNRGLFLPRLSVSGPGAWAVALLLVALIALARALRRRARVQGGLDRAAWSAIVAAFVVAGGVLAALHARFSWALPAATGFNVSGGIAVLPELLALTLGLSIYNSTFLAEIFRAGIQSVPAGQGEAAATLGLAGWRAAWLVVLPQALRVALPPAAGQYQTLAKASSLAAAVGYPDLMQIVGGTVLSQTGQALEAMALVVVFYALINLLIALGVNLANGRLMRRHAR